MNAHTLFFGLIVFVNGPTAATSSETHAPHVQSEHRRIENNEPGFDRASSYGHPDWWSDVRNLFLDRLPDIPSDIHDQFVSYWDTIRRRTTKRAPPGSVQSTPARSNTTHFVIGSVSELQSRDADPPRIELDQDCLPNNQAVSPWWSSQTVLLAASDLGDDDYFSEMLGPTMKEAIAHARVDHSDVGKETPPESADPTMFMEEKPDEDHSEIESAASAESNTQDTKDQESKPPVEPSDSTAPQVLDQVESLEKVTLDNSDNSSHIKEASDEVDTDPETISRQLEANDFQDFESPSSIVVPIDRNPAKIAPISPKIAREGSSSIRIQQVDDHSDEVIPIPSLTGLTWHKRQPKLIQVMVDTSVAMKMDAAIDRAELVDPSTADIRIPSPNQVILVGKHVGTTQLTLKSGDEERLFRVSVEPNVSDLSALIQSISPRSNVRIHTLKGQIILSGRVSDAESARRIEELARVYQGGDVINHLSVSGVQQTLLRVVVAEVNKDATRRLGINWALGGSSLSRGFFLGNNLNQLNPTTFTSSGVTDLTRGQLTYSVLPTSNGPNTNITFGFPRAELQFFLNALRSNGLARTLAEPNLIAISGQTASFLAGGEVPIPVTQGGAVAGAITIDYKEFGVRLAFTPTVVGEQVIRLHVMTEVSDAVPSSSQVGSTPLFSFRTRRVESTIECGNNQTFAIAGLLSEQVNAIASKVPGLGDLPVLGPMFSSVDYQRSNTELIVLVTPQLVEALNPGQVGPVPGSTITEPTDYELFGLQKLQGIAQSSHEDDEAIIEEKEFGNMVSKPRNARTAKRLHGRWGMEDTEPDAN